MVLAVGACGCGALLRPVLHSTPAFPPASGRRDAGPALAFSPAQDSHSRALVGWCAHSHTHTGVCKLKLDISFKKRLNC